MAHFFIDRPVFAWVIAILITLGGGLAVFRLPTAAYPNIAPPQVGITAPYPGADAETIERTVTQVIEQQLTGIDNVLYFTSSSSSGVSNITLTFETGTDPDVAAVQTQNRVALATPRLPGEVIQQGITVAKANSDFLMAISIRSKDNRVPAQELQNIVSAQILDGVQRVKGVGGATQFGSPYGMRIWLDPDKLRGYRMSAAEALNRVRGQNVQFATGSLGARPSVPGQQVTAQVTAEGRFTSVEEFENVILRTEPNGTSIRVKDVARVELGSANYGFDVRLNNEPVAGFGVLLQPGANALEVAEALKVRMDELQRSFPAGVEWFIPVRLHQVHHHRHSRSDRHPGDRRGAGVHRDARVPAELPRDADPDAGGAGGAHGRDDRHVPRGLLDQPAHVVRHGARHRHRGGRRHRGHRVRRAHHARGTPAAERSDAQGDVADHQPDHRDLAGARRRIHSECAAVRIGRSHLSAVRPHHRDLDGVLRVPRVVADAGAVRDDAASRAPEGKHRLPLVQPRLRQGAGFIPAIGEVLDAPSALVAGGFRRAAAHRRPGILARAQQLRTRRRSGFRARPGADAGRHDHAAHAGVHVEGERRDSQARSGGLGVRGHRLQLPRRWRERGYLLHSAQGLGRSRGDRCGVRRLGLHEHDDDGARRHRVLPEPADDPRPGRIRRLRFLARRSHRRGPPCALRRHGSAHAERLARAT